MADQDDTTDSGPSESDQPAPPPKQPAPPPEILRPSIEPSHTIAASEKPPETTTIEHVVRAPAPESADNADSSGKAGK